MHTGSSIAMLKSSDCRETREEDGIITTPLSPLSIAAFTGAQIAENVSRLNDFLDSYFGEYAVIIERRRDDPIYDLPFAEATTLIYPYSYYNESVSITLGKPLGAREVLAQNGSIEKGIEILFSIDNSVRYTTGKHENPRVSKTGKRLVIPPEAACSLILHSSIPDRIIREGVHVIAGYDLVYTLLRKLGYTAEVNEAKQEWNQDQLCDMMQLILQRDAIVKWYFLL